MNQVNEVLKQRPDNATVEGRADRKNLQHKPAPKPEPALVEPTQKPRRPVKKVKPMTAASEALVESAPLSADNFAKLLIQAANAKRSKENRVFELMASDSVRSAIAMCKDARLGSDVIFALMQTLEPNSEIKRSDFAKAWVAHGYGKTEGESE